MSNDSQEGSIILDVLLQMARESGLDQYTLARLETQLRRAYDFFDGLGFCLSEDGDLLSQWRGYANDGRGASIGFDSDYLRQLSGKFRERNERGFTLNKLVYDRDGQQEIAAEHFAKIKALLELGAFRSEIGTILLPTSEGDKERIKKATSDGTFAILSLMLRMFEIKSPAFAEEKEWRLVSFSTKSGEESGTRFNAGVDKIVPYFEVKLEDLGIDSISSIVLGPKHQTPLHVVERLLLANGFKNAAVSRSAATYR
ncbi:DUF2971 domain-containing protein [Pseudoxanthomonas gei]|nr:DUF2971 domain-containing protein [Pseudoxanthomonas gei]